MGRGQVSKSRVAAPGRGSAAPGPTSGAAWLYQAAAELLRAEPELLSPGAGTPQLGRRKAKDGDRLVAQFSLSSPLQGGPGAGYGSALVLERLGKGWM